MLSETPIAPAVRPVPSRRPLRKRAVHYVRRGHLYLGLFLVPWAVLYGVSAFLFNHPTAFSDAPTASFDKSATAGSAIDDWPTASDIADAVVGKLNATQKPATPYTIPDRAAVRFNRENAFATVKADGQTVSVLIDVRHGGGTVRSTPTREVPKIEKAPFAVGRTAEPRPRGNRGGEAPPPAGAGLQLDRPLGERVKAAVPGILTATGFPQGEVTVTSVPEVVFPLVADGRTWTATYNPLTGTVDGKPAEAAAPAELSTRNFIRRLHLAHGYPGEPNAKWWWAVIVDAMAFTMVFWGLSGLVMWWQIKATRRPGLVVLLLSAAAATALGVAMHSALTQPV